MPEVEYSTTADLPVETVWDFVREMDNWAPFVAGYQGHEKESETDSVWTLKGDVGVLARTLRFRVHVSEWAGPERVAFTLTGLNEPMQGEGLFRMAPEAAAPDAAGAPVTGAAAPARRNPLLRLFEAIVRRLLRRARGRVDRAAAAGGAARARLTFRLRIDPGGPMAPMVSAMMRPAMLPAAEDLANRILAHLESSNARR